MPSPLAYFEYADDSPRRAAWFLRFWAACGLLLWGVTWRLWVPQTAYPQIPLVRGAGALPMWVEGAALGAVLLSLVVVLLAAGQRGVARVALYALALAVVVLVLIDQHRFQPWAYQFVLIALVMASCGPGRALALVRVLAISIYVYSALGKFDFQFIHTVGQQMITAVTDWLGIAAPQQPSRARLLAAAALPAVELGVGILLLVRRTRRWGVLLATGLHASLLLVLGPLGLDHQPGVLAWNVYFIGQAHLFGKGVRTLFRSGPASDGPVSDRRGGPSWAVWLIALAVLLPALERFGRFDHWPSWALYAPHSSRVDVEVHRVAIDRLPEALRQLAPEEASADGWVRLPIDAWSIQTLGVPIYPQDRFQLGVAEAIALEGNLDREIRVTVRSAASRYTGRRERTRLVGRHQISAAADRYHFNAHPRRR